MQLSRCFGNKKGSEIYAKYHDEEWGVPLKEDKALFELLILEGFQAGLSFEIILKKREGFRKAFHNFDVVKVEKMSDHELEKLTQNPEIIRNRNKIFSARQNASVFIEIQKEFGSFSKYIWAYVDYKPIKSHYVSIKDVPCSSNLSKKISKDLKKRGMKFVGEKIIYSFMQAAGLLNDHVKTCHKYTESAEKKIKL
jgi:DNA-3-methyladenine glycosylase I